jgi:hypothetical protein
LELRLSQENGQDCYAIVNDIQEIWRNTRLLWDLSAVGEEEAALTKQWTAIGTWSYSSRKRLVKQDARLVLATRMCLEQGTRRRASVSKMSASPSESTSRMNSPGVVTPSSSTQHLAHTHQQVQQQQQPNYTSTPNSGSRGTHPKSPIHSPSHAIPVLARVSPARAIGTLHSMEIWTAAMLGEMFGVSMLSSAVMIYMHKAFCHKACGDKYVQRQKLSHLTLPISLRIEELMDDDREANQLAQRLYIHFHQFHIPTSVHAASSASQEDKHSELSRRSHLPTSQRQAAFSSEDSPVLRASAAIETPTHSNDSHLSSRSVEESRYKDRSNSSRDKSHRDQETSSGYEGIFYTKHRSGHSSGRTGRGNVPRNKRSKARSADHPDDEEIAASRDRLIIGGVSPYSSSPYPSRRNHPDRTPPDSSNSTSSGDNTSDISSDEMFTRQYPSDHIRYSRVTSAERVAGNVYSPSSTAKGWANNKSGEGSLHSDKFTPKSPTRSRHDGNEYHASSSSSRNHYQPDLSTDTAPLQSQTTPTPHPYSPCKTKQSEVRHGDSMQKSPHIPRTKSLPAHHEKDRQMFMSELDRSPSYSGGGSSGVSSLQKERRESKRVSDDNKPSKRRSSSGGSSRGSSDGSRVKTSLGRREGASLARVETYDENGHRIRRSRSRSRSKGRNQKKDRDKSRTSASRSQDSRSWKPNGDRDSRMSAIDRSRSRGRSKGPSDTRRKTNSSSPGSSLGRSHSRSRSPGRGYHSTGTIDSDRDHYNESRYASDKPRNERESEGQFVAFGRRETQSTRTKKPQGVVVGNGDGGDGSVSKQKKLIDPSEG